MFLGLHIADLLVLLLYVGSVIAIGLWTHRYVHSLGDFVMPRRFGKFMMVMFGFGTGTHSDQAVSVASKSFTNGLSGIWYQWLWLFATPFYWLIAPVMRRFRAITTSDIFELRYNRSVGMLFAVIGIAQLMVNIGVMLKGSSAVIDAATGGAVNADLAILIMTVMFVAYGMAGGLSAAIITDFIQGMLTIVFSFILLPLILNAVGGLSGMREVLSDPQMFSLVAPGEIGVFYIFMIALNGLIGITTQPHTLSNCAAGRTEMDGRIGFMGGSLLKRICTVAWSLTGLAGAAYYIGGEMHPDMIYGVVAREFLPALAPGLMGIFLAALLASVMSSCDAFMIASAGLFTENIYRRILPGKGEHHYIKVVRAASLLVVAGGLAFTYWLPNVIAGLEIFWKIAPMMGIAFWMGLFWRRMTSAGAWASTITAFFMWWLSTKSFFIEFTDRLPFSDFLQLTVHKSDILEIYLPWQMLFYLVSGTLAGILVSLISKPVPKERLNRYFELARTPVTEEEATTEVCRLPEGKEPAPRRVFFPQTSLEIPIPSKTSMIGFLIGWAFVAAIITTVYLIAN